MSANARAVSGEGNVRLFVDSLDLTFHLRDNSQIDFRPNLNAGLPMRVTENAIHSHVVP